MLFQTCLTFFPLLNTQENVWKNVGKQTTLTVIVIEINREKKSCLFLFFVFLLACMHAYGLLNSLFNVINIILFYPFDFHCMDKNNKTIFQIKQKKSYRLKRT